MTILFKILHILLIVLAILILLLILILLIPFRYKLELYNSNGDEYGLDLKYIIFNLKAKLLFKPNFLLRITFLNKTLIDTSIDSNKKLKKDSIGDTEFIKNKDIEKASSDIKGSVKELILSSKKSEDRIKKTAKQKDFSEQDKKQILSKTTSLIDDFKNLLPVEFIYFLKKVAIEIINLLNRLKPYTCNIEIVNSNGDPYSSGMMMAIASPLYAFLGDSIKIKSNDSKDNFYKITCFGRPMLMSLAMPILRLIIDKRIRKFIFKKK